jgi:hypothetical protein
MSARNLTLPEQLRTPPWHGGKGGPAKSALLSTLVCGCWAQPGWFGHAGAGDTRRLSSVPFVGLVPRLAGTDLVHSSWLDQEFVRPMA